MIAKVSGKDNSHAPLILLVEDDIEILLYLTSILENEYLLEIARNGNDGVRKATDLIPDLVISDVMMPEKDGLTLCQELKSDLKTNHIPVILLTARAEFNDKILA
ncbi:MAG: response regulator [Saprospiraceae bacterium]|nr:response regulator [Saprospiraceae bacterium]